MWRALLMYIVFYIASVTCGGNFSNADDNEEETDRSYTKVIHQFKMRCTRRFSPGVCANRVSPVWTFVFDEHNCTERLGCANYFRANRFKSYNICMRQCHGLVDVYLQMVEVESSYINQRVPLREGLQGSARIKTQDRYLLSQEELEDISNDYEKGVNDTYSLVYKDVLDSADIFPPDVDQVDGEIRTQYDLLHP